MIIVRKVYILGAGFSKTFGLPLANEFLEAMVKEIENGSFSSKIDTTCRNFYPSFRSALANYPNVEDLYNYLRSMINYYVLMGVEPNKYMRDFGKEFNLEVANFLEKKKQSIKKEDEEYIYYFCEQLRPGDVVITFNWDNVLETYLAKSKKNFSFNFHDDSSKKEIVILKLHGSIDWFSTDVLPDNKQSYQLILQYNDGKKVQYLIRVLDTELIDRLRKEGMGGFFVPPLLYKDEMFKPIKQLWGDAHTVMGNFLIKTYIGYSFPKEDMMTRLLCGTYHYDVAIAGDNRLDGEQIIVINPDEGMELHYKKFCNDKITFFCSTFKRSIDVSVEKKKLQSSFLPFRDALLRDSDKHVQYIASMIFSDDVNKVNKYEVEHLKEHVELVFNKTVKL